MWFPNNKNISETSARHETLQVIKLSLCFALFQGHLVLLEGEETESPPLCLHFQETQTPHDEICFFGIKQS